MRTTKRTGFTIVELLIVIVVIGILAAIIVVAFGNVQQRSRDSKRLSDFVVLQKAVEMFKTDNGRYPYCGATEGATVTSCEVSGLATALIPRYIQRIPSDPFNVTNYQYFYARGYKKNGATGHSLTSSDQDYSMGAHLEAQACGCSAAWGSQINYMVGNQ
ncbi:MAG: prepilin-type N-terminal cleavage/methylation domain-containing protein [Candidatus Saccharimonadales bacterium]